VPAEPRAKESAAVIDIRLRSVQNIGGECR